jgi:hypothetical protein
MKMCRERDAGFPVIADHSEGVAFPLDDAGPAGGQTGLLGDRRDQRRGGGPGHLWCCTFAPQDFAAARRRLGDVPDVVVMADVHLDRLASARPFARHRREHPVEDREGREGGLDHGVDARYVEMHRSPVEIG